MVAGALMIPVEAKAEPLAPPVPPKVGDNITIDSENVPFGTDSHSGTFVIPKGNGRDKDLLVYWAKGRRKLDNGSYKDNYSIIKASDTGSFGPAATEGSDSLDALKDDIRSFNKEKVEVLIMSNRLCMYWLPDPVATVATVHTHSWTYGTIYEPTEDTDGLEGEYCSCGAQRNTCVIPAIDAIIQNRYKQIDAAHPGVDIILEMKNNCNFSQAFMKKLASKNDCSFILRFTYEKKHYEAYIPAGTTFDTSFEWYGPEKIMEMFKWKQLN